MKTLTFRKKSKSVTRVAKNGDHVPSSEEYYELEGTTITTCSSGFESALGIGYQSPGTMIEIEIAAVHRIREREKLV